MSRHVWVVAFSCSVWLVAASPPAHAQFDASRCADCHVAQTDVPAPRHLSDWDQSAHDRHGVGCESCHGGDPTTFERFRAHQGILNPRNPASPVHRMNLPTTCGKCHAGPYVAFQRSRHHALLRAGDRDVPSCATCHGEVAAVLLSPKQLQGQCANCHGAAAIAPNTDLPAEGRRMLEGIRDARALLKQANAVIARVKDRTRRQSLAQAAEQAEVPLLEATDAGHAFVFDRLQERLSVARTRIAALYDRLANPDVR